MKVQALRSSDAAPAACPAQQGTDDRPEEAGQVWIFGFGSLVYRPGFAYQEKVFGYVRGWRRVFWQGSTDHRGVPGAPGRVATIVPAAPDSLVWGSAFHLAGTPEQQQHILKVLEHREKQYDQRVRMDVLDREGDAERVAVRGALVFIASHSPVNANWLGQASREAIAQQVARAVGPSGPNWEYVYRLAAAFREHGAADAELDWLAERVRSIRGASGPDAEEGVLHSNGRQRPDRLDD